jgi:phenylalanyl-tRNA synthetase beta chain
MKISYNWLKNYISTDKTPEEIGRILTDTGLEVESTEKLEAVKGGLEGVIIGQVVSCDQHPDADKLKLTVVDIGNEKLQIVCGASNVGKGQKVVVATVGCTLYPNPDEPFKIKAAKIRGVDSFGMICAEDELGLGNSHSGIMVLPNDVAIGTKAAIYFDLEDDYIFEIGLTPNRADAMGHIGVARDLMAYLNFHQQKKLKIEWPEVKELKPATESHKIAIEIEEKTLCSAYCGISLSDIKIAPSPEWLQKKLRAIGLNPINNVVDATNFVMRELGTPIHAFDTAFLNGKISVKKAAKGQNFKTLDGIERKLSGEELMISNGKDNLCIAGVLGGVFSSVSAETTSIFLESAVFDAVSIRKTARAHSLNTDASFRFERGVDPELTLYALRRTAGIIQEIAGGEIAMNEFSWNSGAFKSKEISIDLSRINSLIGFEIPIKSHLEILKDLDFTILNENGNLLEISIPGYRIDVTREADVTEEILRIFGFNQIPIPEKWNLALSNEAQNKTDKIQGVISETLVSKGFNEVMNNSLTKSAYIEKFGGESFKKEHNVTMLNPLSQDLNVMRQTLLFGILENMQRNQNRQNPNLKFFEFGKTYFKFPAEYNEKQELILCITGEKYSERWNSDKTLVSYFTLKGLVTALFDRLGLTPHLQEKDLQNDLFSQGQELDLFKKSICQLGFVKDVILSHFDLKNPVFCAIIDWDLVLQNIQTVKTQFKELPKTFSVRRDFSLLLNKNIQFKELEKIAKLSNKNILKSVGLFDVYEGDKIEEDKKSYALSFTFQDDEKTLTDEEIDKVMVKIKDDFEKNLGAVLRS